jgi:hypothetical protein
LSVDSIAADWSNDVEAVMFCDEEAQIDLHRLSKNLHVLDMTKVYVECAEVLSK